MIEIFIGTLLGIHSSALILKYFYSSNEEYKKLELNRKNYFIKNLFKSYFLFIFSIIGTYYWIQGRILNNWDQGMIHRLGLMYSAVDCYGLLTIRNMQISTIAHHSVVLTFSFLNLFVSYPNNSIEINLLIIYTLFSSYSFLVNNYLANRIIIKDKNKLRLTLKSAYYSYVGSCSINWIIQYMGLLYGLVYDLVDLYMLIYMILIHLVIYDDIVLIKFLRYNYNKLEAINNVKIKVIDE
jgi:hypothetical protein